ncbi:hypothetical protein KR054_000804, partial [Drosophila jambulina]
STKLSGGLARWSLQLQGFNFTIEHRKGSESVVAEALSRCVEEISADPTELQAFETTEFAGDEKLKSLCGHETSGMPTGDKFRVIQDKVRKSLETSYDRSRQRYHQRARVFTAKSDQDVYRWNFVLSDFGKQFNAKFPRKFLKSRVVKAVGYNAYELQGRSFGVYPAKDIRV